MFKKIFKILFNKDNLLAMIFVIGLGLIISKTPIKLEFLNPIEDAFEDFDITDLYYSRFRGDIPADDRITIVNIGMLPRAGIADEINIINKFNPKVVGVDAFFGSLKEGLENEDIDIALSEALKKTKNLVMVSRVAFKPSEKEKKNFDTLQTSHPMFIQHAHQGYANLITSGTRNNILTSDLATGLATCRTFTAVEKLKGGKEQLAFGVKVAQLFDKEKAQKIIDRKNEVEYINYRGNHDKFNLIDVAQLFEMYDAGAEEELANLFEKKIVLLGFMGEDINTKSLTDKFYTPMNPTYIGKSEHDMFGIVVHANIISMILNGEYIDESPTWANLLISFFITYLSVALFSLLYKQLGFWFDGLSFIIQVLLTILILFVIVEVYDNLSIRVDWGYGILAMILTPNLIEIYYGLVKRLYLKSQKGKVRKNKRTIELE